MIIIPNTNKEISEVVKNKIQVFFNKNNFTNINKSLSFSIGYSSFDQTDSLNELINKADIKMYRDKKNYKRLQNGKQ